MLEAGEAALGFIAGRSREDLDSDRMLLFALVRALEVLGEAASKVSAGTREAIPSAPWPAIVATRNRLIHAYFDVDATIVWNTVTGELPSLLAALDRALAEGPGR